MDKQPKKDFNRPPYKRLVENMKEEDLLYILSIDRLGLPNDSPKIIKDWERRKITTEQAAKKCKVSRSTFYRRVREYKLSYNNKTQ